MIQQGQSGPSEAFEILESEASFDQQDSNLKQERFEDQNSVITDISLISTEQRHKIKDHVQISISRSKSLPNTSSRKIISQQILLKVKEMQMDTNFAYEILSQMQDLEFVGCENDILLHRVINRMIITKIQLIPDIEQKWLQTFRVADVIVNDRESLRIEQTGFQQKMKCFICLDYINNNLTCMIEPCEHSFCCGCVRSYLQNAISTSQVDGINCPQQACDVVLSDQTIQNYIEPEFYDKMLKFRQMKILSQNQDLRFCPRPGCEFHTVRQNNELILVCQCEQKICFECSNAEHSNQSCIDALDQTYKIAIKQYQIYKCPSCKIPIQKSDGCNHMTCFKCQHQFCWLCRTTYSEHHFNLMNIFGCPGLLNSDTEPFKSPKLCRALFLIVSFCLIPLTFVIPIILIFLLPIIALDYCLQDFPLKTWLELNRLKVLCALLVNFLLCTVLSPFSIVVSTIGIVIFGVLFIFFTPMIITYIMDPGEDPNPDSIYERIRSRFGQLGAIIYGFLLCVVSLPFSILLTTLGLIFLILFGMPLIISLCFRRIVIA